VSASAERTAFAPRVPSLERFRLALEENATEALRQGGTTLLALPAPVAPIEALLAGSTADALAWAKPAGFELSALGSAEVVEASGTNRFRQIAERGREVLARTRTLGLLGAAPVAPRLYGGFSFAARAPSSELWRPFGEASFVLPELSYVVENGEARLVVAVAAERLARSVAREALFDAALRGFQAVERGLDPAPSVALTAVPKSERPADEWADLVEVIRAEIAQGTLEKVVLARRVAFELGREPDAALVLARLRPQAPECTRFLVRKAGISFLGATPEWLAKKHGATLETEAVAGSMSALDREGAARLLESGKDRAEHALVLREIVRALSPLASSVEHGEKPELYELRHLLHFRSRVRATLRGSPHLLQVVEQLHPTPAVGGVPTARAVEWIGSHEPDERGWYAGPIGWFDAAGDGEFAVALRSGLLEGRHAHLYVGAGIVDRSSPAAEFTETRWKLGALLGALGVTE
jgi:menaquinone-specific isochorismate synthase